MWFWTPYQKHYTNSLNSFGHYQTDEYFSITFSIFKELETPAYVGVSLWVKYTT